MNFLDAYDISDPAVAAATSPNAPEPTLNEEVTQVVGQLSRFWGGFRKQSQSVFETARKDIGQVVSQAQKELTKLTADQPEAGTSREVADGGESDAAAEPISASPEPEAGPSSEGSAPESSDTQTTPTKAKHNRTASVSAAAQNLFSRLQASLPADLATTVQAKLPESIKQGAGSVDFGQLRSSLTTEFQRVQDITRAQAEQYVHKSEELLRDAGEFLKEAVKVVPPEEGGQATPSVLWDGSDIWMLPDYSTTSSISAKGKGKEKDGRQSSEGLRAVATRAEALLKQLRHDPEVIKQDPEADERAAQMWKEWHTTNVESKEGGIDNEEWQAAVKKALADPADGEALQRTLDAVVPSILTVDVFWTRYFFRVHQVESEEQRRKALLQGTAESEEDFDWESDEEEDITQAASKAAAKPGQSPSVASLATSVASGKTITAIKSGSPAPGSATDSPRRLSSEDGSYDVVSSQVSNAETKTDEASSDGEEEESGEEDEEEGEDDEDDDEEDDEDDDEEEEEVQKAGKKAPQPKTSTQQSGEDEEDSDWE